MNEQVKKESMKKVWCPKSGKYEMTDITKHVPDRETCEMLKEAGFPQDTYFYWLYMEAAQEWSVFPTTLPSKTYYAAPLASEILEMLPEYVGDFVLEMSKDSDFFYLRYVTVSRVPQEFLFGLFYLEHKNPATACALMWLRLRKEGKL